MALQKIELVLLLQDLEFGGTQRYAVQLLKHLDRQRFRPSLWVLRGGEDMAPLVRETGVEPVWLSRSDRVSPTALSRLWRRLRTSRPGILYTLTVVPNIWGRILGRLAGTPAVVSGYRSLYPKQYDRWLWPLCRRIICNARALEEIMIRRCHVPAGRIAVIPNAVDSEAFFPAPDLRAAEPTVLFVGRLVPDKDPLTLLGGLKRVAEKVPQVRFLIVGQGPLTSQVSDFLKVHGLAERTTRVPGAADPRPYLQQAWVLALPSVREASPHVIIEAMASGLPVVASRVGGIPELVVEGPEGTGLLVPPRNPEALAAALVQLLENNHLCQEMGQRARQRAIARHAPPDMVRRTEEVLLAVAREAGLAD